MAINLDFKDQVNQLEKTANVFAEFQHEAETYRLVKSADAKKGNRYYIYGLQDKLGSGTFGDIYKAYPINPNTGEVLYDHPFVVKEISSKKNNRDLNDIVQETTILSRYYGAESPITLEDRYLLISRFLPGIHPVPGDLKGLTREMSLLTFEQRINLINEIVLSFNLMHHNTPHSGPAIVHGDVKSANIVVDMKDQNNVADVYPIDFGSSHPLKDEGETMHAILRGTLGYEPPEFPNFVSEKTDIYAIFGSLIAPLLGAIDPLRDKDICHEEYESAGLKGEELNCLVRRTQYNLTGFLQGFDLKKYPHDIKSLIEDFSERMHLNDMKTRASSDETLRFFTSLNQYCKVFNNDATDDETLALHFSKMFLLSKGFWNLNFGNRKIAEITKNTDLTKGAVAETFNREKTFEQHPFNNPILFAKGLKQLAEKDLLDEESLTALASMDSNNNLSETMLSYLALNNAQGEVFRTKLATKDMENYHINNPLVFMDGLKSSLLRGDNYFKALVVLDKHKLLTQELIKKLQDCNQYPHLFATSLVMQEQNLQKLLDIAKKYTFDIGGLKPDDYTKIFSASVFNVAEATKSLLRLYIEKRTQDPQEYHSFWSQFSYSKSKKIAAARCCISNLGHNMKLPSAAKQGTLGDLIKDLQQLSPDAQRKNTFTIRGFK